MLIDPLGIPFMQKALGSGQLSEQDLRQIMQGSGGAGMFGQGMPMSSGVAGPTSPQLSQNLGIGPMQPPPQFQGLMGSSDQPGRGPNQQIMNMLSNLGGSASFDQPSGNWMPGPQGFPEPSGGGGIGNGALLRMIGGK